jgi:prepilin-type N-terminal cleavage/methylation domain-containing protein
MATPKQRGFSLIELAVTLVIISILAFTSIKAAAPVVRETRLVSNLVAIKSSIIRARGRAIESSVRVLVECSNNEISAEADSDRNGTFGEVSEDVVIGEGLGNPVVLKFSGVEMVPDSDSRVAAPPLAHWTGLAGPIANFPSDRFVINATGQISIPDGGAPTQGAFFLVNKDGFAGAVFLTMMGEIRIAYRQKNGTWTWSDN